jgi:ComF family protein
LENAHPDPYFHPMQVNLNVRPLSTAVRPLRALASLFFPQLCAGCGSHLISDRQSICLRCLSRLPLTGFFEQPDNPVEKSFWGRIPVQAAGSLFYFTGRSTMQNILHELKYRGNRECGVELGRMMGRALHASGRFNDMDLIVPMPLFGAKARIRGYNQSALLGEGASSVLGIPAEDSMLRRIRNTGTQTHKNRNERWENVRDVFKARKPEAFAGRSVLLVDDVVTTGASLEACGRALLDAGCESLFIATSAFTER